MRAAFAGRGAPAAPFPAFAAVLLLTGCGAGEPAVTVEAEPAADIEAADASTDESDARSAALDCLHGTWIVTEADLDEYYAQMSAETGMTLLPSGGAELTFDAGALQYDYLADYGLGMVMEGGPDAAMRITGMLGGRFDVDAAGSTVQFTATGDLLTVSVEVAGFEVPVDAVDESIDHLMAADPFRDGAFRCDAQTLTLRFSAGTGEVPLELDRKE